MKKKVLLVSVCLFLFFSFRVSAENSLDEEQGTAYMAYSDAYSQDNLSVGRKTGGSGSGAGKRIDPNRMVLGGTFGMGFSRNYTAINISPQLGYAVSGFFTAGGGVSYNFYHYGTSDLSLHYFGLNVYARFFPVRFLTLQIQPEIYNKWGSERGLPIKSGLVPALLVGLGGTIPLSSNGGISIMLYYDVLQNAWSPYGNQIFYTFGYTFFF